MWNGLNPGSSREQGRLGCISTQWITSQMFKICISLPFAHIDLKFSHCSLLRESFQRLSSLNSALRNEKEIFQVLKRKCPPCFISFIPFILSMLWLEDNPGKWKLKENRTRSKQISFYSPFENSFFRVNLENSQFKSFNQMKFLSTSVQWSHILSPSHHPYKNSAFHNTANFGGWV